MLELNAALRERKLLRSIIYLFQLPVQFGELKG